MWDQDVPHWHCITFHARERATNITSVSMAMETRVEIPTRGLIVDLLSVHPDMTYQEIGKIVERSRQRVGQVAREAGLTRKSRLQRRDITVEKVVELYYCGAKDIARILGCHRNTITKRLRAAGVSPSESYSRRTKLYWRRARQVARVATPRG